MNEKPSDAMNQNPERPVSEDTLTRWIDGRLQPDELTAMEREADSHPALRREKEMAESIGRLLRNSLPAVQEPPSADFFTSQIMTQIRAEAAPPRLAPARPSFAARLLTMIRTPWFAPLASAAVVAVAFLAAGGGSAPKAGKPIFADVYAPDPKVTASAFYSEDAGAAVIDLQGLEPVPADRLIRAYDVASAETSQPGEPQVLVAAGQPERVVMVLHDDGHAPQISVIH